MAGRFGFQLEVKFVGNLFKNLSSWVDRFRHIDDIFCDGSKLPCSLLG